MTTILILDAIFCLYQIAKGISDRHKEAERQEAENRRQADNQRMREEWRRTQAEAKVAIMKQEAEWKKAAKEREELFREQERVRKEQDRQKKEQERQAAQLAKHEDQIMKMNFRLEKAEDEIYHFSSVLETLVSQRESMQAELDSIIAKTTAQDEKRKLDAKFMELSYASAEKYAEVAGNALNGQNQAKETEKMLKRKATLEGKLITLDNRIFTTEQRIKKAEYEKYEAQRKLA